MINSLKIIMITFLTFTNTISAAAGNEIKLGLMVPLTGAESPDAQNVVRAVSFAVKQVNESGGIKGQKINLITADTRSEPKLALEAYEKLIDKDQVLAVIAPFKSAQIVALISKANSSQVTTIIGGTAPRLTEESNFMVRTRPNDRISAAAIIKYIKEETPFTKIAVLHDEGAFGVGGANLLGKYSSDTKIKIVKSLGFKIGEKNLAPLVKEINESGAQLLVAYIANFDDSAIAIKEFAKLKTKMLYLGSPSSLSNVSLAQAKEASEGIFGIVDFVMGKTPESAAYAEAYKKEYNENPDTMASYAYDGVRILANALKEVGPERGKIRSAILNSKVYRGVMGHYQFTSTGDSLNSMSIVKVEDLKLKLIKTISVSQP